MSDTAPSSDPQQVEAARFRAAVSESLLQKIQANINYLLIGAPALGDGQWSLLDETTFNAQRGGGTNWALCDGRDVSSSAYAVLTGLTTLPDMRGRYPRMKDHGAGADAAGDLATGSTYNDAIQEHNHPIDIYEFGGGPISPRILYGFANNLLVRTDKIGGIATTGPFSSARKNLTETRVKTGVWNLFVRID